MGKENKHIKELRQFQTAVEIGSKQTGETRRILTFLNGDTVERDIEERPDLVRRCHNTDGTQTVVGIEMFRGPDFRSKSQKNKKWANPDAALLLKKEQDIYSKYHNVVNALSPDGLNAIYEECIRIAVQNGQRLQTGSYVNYVQSFRHSLTTHIKNVDCYRSNLRKIAAKNEDIKLALLIESYMPYSNGFIIDRDGVRFLSNSFYFSVDIVNLLTEVDPNVIDYIIWCFDTMDYRIEDVVAFKTGRIKDNIKKQNRAIYRYIETDKGVLLFPGD